MEAFLKHQRYLVGRNVRSSDIHFDRMIAGEAGVEHDVFLLDERLKLAIVVTLRPIPDAPEALEYQRIAMVDLETPSRELKIIDDDGRRMDREMVEVLAWEMIEYDDRAMDYTYGRVSSRNDAGKRLKPGEVLRAPQVSTPDYDFGL